MKVLHLISGGDVGGAKSHVLTLVKELQKQIEIKLICFIEGEFYEDAKAMGIDIEVFKQKKRYDLSVINDLCAIIKKEKYDIIHSHGARANFICRFIKGKIKIPCVTTIHSDFMLDFKGNLYKHIVYTKLNIFALKNFDYYIAVSEDFRNMLIGRKFSPDKIFTIYNGIDFNEQIQMMDRESFWEEKGLSKICDKNIVGILARLHPVKGHKVFLEAAKLVLEKYPDVHFVITGDSDEKDGLMHIVSSNHMEGNVHFIGFVDKPYDLLNAIDINTLTSFSESFPYVLLEGAKLKKPTIASKVGGIPMLIIDEDTGYLFQPGNSFELAEKIMNMLKDKDNAQKLGTRLFEHACKNYSLENLSAQHIKIYKKVSEKNQEVKI